MSEIGDEEFDLDELMRRIRAEVESRKAAAGAARSASSALMDPGLEPGMARPPLRLSRLGHAESRAPSKQRYAIEDFLEYHDEEFLRHAYRSILRRDPDGSGFASFLDRLRSGRLSRIEVLGRMRYSQEGRAAAVPVAGLALRFAVTSMERIPILGRVIAILHGAFRLPEVVGSLERLESEHYRRDRDLRREIDANSEAVEAAVAERRPGQDGGCG